MGRLISPFPAALFRLGRRLDIDKDDIDPDFFHAFQVNKEFRPTPAEAFSPGHNDPLHTAFGIGKHDIAYSSETLSVCQIDRFFAV